MFYSIFVKMYINDMVMLKLLKILILFTFPLTIAAQEKLGNGLTMDKVIHDFGDILLEDGAVSCRFTVKNNSEKAAVIYNVISSCGCTDVKWTREPIRPGESGTISVTYSNDEGAYPFDKNLTVYFSDIKKPVILKIRGVSHEKKKTLEELYPIKLGSLGIKESYIKCGNLEQKGSRSDAVRVANLSQSPIRIDFKDISPYLAVEVKPNPIPARSTAELRFTISASRDKWGKNDYWATPLINGTEYGSNNKDSRLGFWAFTKENFNDLTEDQKDNGPIPEVDESTYSFGKKSQGTAIHATYKLKNIGKESLRIYKVDINACKWSHSTIPLIAHGEEAEFRVHLDTASMPKGESLTIITLVTNSPLRPIINLFIAGWLE